MMTRVANEHYYDVEIGEIINICYAQMDPNVIEQIIPNSDGSYTIFLNARCSEEELQIAFFHARDHILFDDWQYVDAEEIESRAHKRGL